MIRSYSCAMHKELSVSSMQHATNSWKSCVVSRSTMTVNWRFYWVSWPLLPISFLGVSKLLHWLLPGYNLVYCTVNKYSACPVGSTQFRYPQLVGIAQLLCLDTTALGHGDCMVWNAVSLVPKLSCSNCGEGRKERAWYTLFVNALILHKSV